MENKTDTNLSSFAKKMLLEAENRIFLGHISSLSVGYLLLTLWLNNIRATAHIWFVWVLIIIQLLLYFSIFIECSERSKALGLNKNIAFSIFFILAVLGRINDWEVIIIPLVVVIMLVFSARNKKVLEKGKSLPQ